MSSVCFHYFRLLLSVAMFFFFQLLFETVIDHLANFTVSSQTFEMVKVSCVVSCCGCMVMLLLFCRVQLCCVVQLCSVVSSCVVLWSVV